MLATMPALCETLTRTLEHVRRKKRLAFDMHLAFEARTASCVGNLVRRVTPTLHRLKGTARPLPIVEDVAVPPGVLPSSSCACKTRSRDIR